MKSELMICPHCAGNLIPDKYVFARYHCESCNKVFDEKNGTFVEKLIGHKYRGEKMDENFDNYYEEIKISDETVECPNCSAPVRANQIKIGRHVCPYCDKVFMVREPKNSKDEEELPGIDSGAIERADMEIKRELLKESGYDLDKRIEYNGKPNINANTDNPIVALIVIVVLCLISYLSS